MKEYFPEVHKINYKGPETDDPLAFKYYNPEETVDSLTMAEHLRFGVAYWHTFNERGVDPFGAATMERPWDKPEDPMSKAKAKAEAAFEFMDKLGLNFFSFHDRDIAPVGETLKETNSNLDEMADFIEGLMEEHEVKPLLGAANLFEHQRYVHGAATSPNSEVFAYAASQVKKALEIINQLGGLNYVFWGGREGYNTILNTDWGREHENLARFLEMIKDYAKSIGFSGQLLIEPKPMEPTKHQYDFDVAHMASFLRKYGLEGHFKANLEANHATLAGHDFHHELRYARENDLLGSVDANQGDPLLGWDTDQFPTNIYKTALAMYEVIQNGKLAPGGLNFDAKVRRGSFELQDLFIGHIEGMDTIALGFKVAHKLIEDGALERFKKERYSSYGGKLGKKISREGTSLEELDEYVKTNIEEPIKLKSGKQEKLEGIINSYIMSIE